MLAGKRKYVICFRQWIILISLAFLFSACSQLSGYISGTSDRGRVKTGKPYDVFGVTYYPLKSSEGFEQEGLASWYGKKFHNRLTANGEIYDMHSITAAHKTLPLPTWVRVHNLDNHRSMVLRINDRGPFVADRIIDLSYAAAKVLGVDKKGIARVRVIALPMDEQLKMEGSYKKPSRNKKVAKAISRPIVKSESLDIVEKTTVFETIAKPKVREIKQKKLAKTMVATGEVYVQAGSFHDFANAKKLAARLTTVGTARVQNKKVDGKNFYRVIVGPFTSMVRAENAVKRLKNMGISSLHLYKP
ncbi:MAG: septal ring lytic transglycosylase RlpA family protein [Magnetococcales bacterium]|nr:septal ring lytic transglycosylase RlpA family protein [Magnetococcales bacterium]